MLISQKLYEGFLFAHRYFLIYVHTLEVHPFQPFFLNYEACPVHISPHMFCTNPSHHFLTRLLIILFLHCCS